MLQCESQTKSMRCDLISDDLRREIITCDTELAFEYINYGQRQLQD